jgi:hypothetical protein
MFDSFDDAFGLLALDFGAERSEAGLELRQEHVLVRLFGLCADSGQAVAGQRQMGQGRKMQVTHDALSCQHLVTPQSERAFELGLSMFLCQWP